MPGAGHRLPWLRRPRLPLPRHPQHRTGSPAPNQQPIPSQSLRGNNRPGTAVLLCLRRGWRETLAVQGNPSPAAAFATRGGTGSVGPGHGQQLPPRQRSHTWPPWPGPRGRARARLCHRGLCSRHRAAAPRTEAASSSPTMSPPGQLGDVGARDCAGDPGGFRPQAATGRASRAQRRDSHGAGGFLPRTRLRISRMPLIFFVPFHLTPERVQTHRL